MSAEMQRESDRRDAVPGDGRDETQTERLDRNWNELLQELRVTQTGTQLLTGFLITLAFQPTFHELDGFQVAVYLALVLLAALSTVLGLAPVTLHRALFRQRAKERVVEIGDRMLHLTLLCVGLVITGVVLLVFDVVLDRAVGIAVGAATGVVVVALWIVLPLLRRARRAG